ncbi:MAG: hypothetical protein ACK5U4_08365 [Rhodospirillales bacterium]|jgi:hypothetical protein
MKNLAKIAFVAAAASALAACSAPRVGVEGYTDFEASARVETVASAKPYFDYARCFERTARLLPFSNVRYFAERQEVVYELQGYGWWFETIRFAPASAGAGSVAEVKVAHNYSEKWEAGFRKDRYAALQLCASAGS